MECSIHLSVGRKKGCSVLTQQSIAVMRRVANGQLTREAIPAVGSRRLRVCAAVAYMLVHPTGYIDESYHVLRSYRTILEKLTGDVGRLTSVSQELGLHKNESPEEARLQIPGLSRVITLTPPVEIQSLITFTEVTAGDRRQAEAILRRLTEVEGAGVAKALFDLLNPVFGTSQA